MNYFILSLYKKYFIFSKKNLLKGFTKNLKINKYKKPLYMYILYMSLSFFLLTKQSNTKFINIKNYINKQSLFISDELF